MTSGMMKINKMLRIFLLLIAGTLFSTIVVAENKDLMLVLDKLSNIKKSTAAFVEVKNYSLLNEEIKLDGNLEYIAPDILIKKTLNPEPEYFKVTGNELQIKKADGEEYDLLLTDYPLVEMFVEAYRGILSGNLEKLEQYYKVEYSGSNIAWSIKLIPTDEEAREYIDTIIVDGIGTEVNKITTIEPGGDKTVMFIKNKSGKK